MSFLYEDINDRRLKSSGEGVPSDLSDIWNGLNPRFKIRPYQKEAIENFITYFEDKEHPCPKPTQVLFHMATGSGKTLIMAALMLYLYKQGYRKFLFFVNLSYIVKKTKENFTNPASTKFLFNTEGILIDGEPVAIKKVNNFQYPDPYAINICFTTTQGLHNDMEPDMFRSSRMCQADFEGQKIVMISDEAHHLNADTKKKGEKENYNSWENTIKKRIFPMHKDNILLEFTATCDLKNDAIKKNYEDKIIINYPLSRFYTEGYSKDILTLQSDSSPIDKALQALVLSQYRLKLFQKNRIRVKPVVLFKSASVAASGRFKEEFHNVLQNLKGTRLKELSKLVVDNEVMSKAYNYFSENDPEFDNLALELQNDFSRAHCISVNEDDKDIESKQVRLNSLEDFDNPYRGIFEVKKLDEGWDVLNLFDIVRLYETKKSADTISEAQLIGRGARYFPYCLEGGERDLEDKRKYDKNVGDEMRVCETLYYHCQNKSDYIWELRRALREIGIDLEKIIKREYVLKEKFMSDPIYQHGKIFLNDYEEKDTRKDVYSLPEHVRSDMYIYTEPTGIPVSSRLMEEEHLETEDKPVELNRTVMSIKEIAEKVNYAIVNKALITEKMGFNVLKKSFPNLSSTREFIKDDNYLGKIQIEIYSRDKEPSVETLYSAVVYALRKMSKNILNTEGKTPYGTKEFRSRPIRETFRYKTTLNYHRDLPGGNSGGEGVSQMAVPPETGLYLDLSKEDWFAHTDFFGTPEEKLLIKHFKDNYVDKLHSLGYETVYLVRNEREFGIYYFDDGKCFQPDFVLFLRKEKDKETKNFEQIQIFIEPKGSGFLKTDDWKQEFLTRLKKEATIPMELISDGNDYRVWGVRFFNKDPVLRGEFDRDFSNLFDGKL